MRLFAAVLPPPRVLDHVEHALAAVRGPGEESGAVGPLRWAPPEDRHLTLAFYGEVPAGAAQDLAGGLAAVAAGHEPFDLQLRGAGVFDRRVFWIGVGGDVEAMAALTARSVDLGGEVTGRQDGRVRSRAHLTVARVRSQARGRSGPHRRRGEAGGSGPDRVASLAHALAVYGGPLWTVEDFALVESRPGEGRGGGPAYTTVQTFPLTESTTA
ncbi:RNA 2',3'-cyclic phosphodiesterase [Cellulomonas aerilata]|uniref:RNA 2',3'-cyclic phosphodiesterase n=1 Tax=Cellulomonas aerilata TaxID=515326 RepID=A0A512DGH5_9CELL|nr:RNA 2',3'-cyclic phosphodiesterase [Cellulomonas aerilata]GEO35516.1 RNA 2',3'-cyclic phosphodiesterase [Cellulomonas aerilata]